MIKLTTILLEAIAKPKAIFLAGPAGSGKSTVSKQLLPSDYTIINSDDTYEELLKASNIGLKQKDFTPDQLSQASKLQFQARKVAQDKLINSMKNRNSLIIDGTGGASSPLLKKKKELEDLGYTCLMLMIYVSPLTSLERNKQRDRSLMPKIVLETWRDVNKNINTYKEAFGNNFILINNEPKDTNKNFSPELIKPYLEDSKATGKPKSEEEQLKSKQKMEQLNKDIESMVKTLPQFDTLDIAKQKINNFTK